MKGRKEEIVMLYSEEKVKELFDAEKFLIRGQDVITLHQIMKHFGKSVTGEAIDRCFDEGMANMVNHDEENDIDIMYFNYNGLKTIVSSCNVIEYRRQLKEEKEENEKKEEEERKKKEKKRKGYVVVKEEKKKNG